VYISGRKLSKADKLGIHAYIENITRETVQEILFAYFSYKNQRLGILERVRILLETIKHFVRIEHELKIIDLKTYVRIESVIVETSKMTNGWIKYLQQKTPH
jgi:hypothetical protein